MMADSDLLAERDSYTINQFCARNGITRSTFYKLRRSGKGPAEMKMLSDIRISAEAAREWRKARELEAAETPADSTPA